jgi:tetratricopeptide (TPR) repeat protein
MAEATEALAAERPLVLVLEDLHWSDASTVDLLAAIARRREPARLLLIGTYRPLDVIVRGHPLRAVTPQLAVHGASDELLLEPLREADVDRYLTARFGGEVGRRLAPVVHRRTDGLPLFMVNVVEALIRQGLLVEAGGRWEMKASESDVETGVPENLRRMIEQQLAGLTPDEQRLLEAASVAGLVFSAASVAGTLDDDVEVVEDRCEALARREQFLRAGGVEEWPDGTVAARYRFLHVLYQQVLYEQLPPARRGRLHRQIGEREEAGYRATPSERAATLAVHFERGGVAPRAIAYHRRAAETALERCAYPEAVEHLTRGRELLDRVADPDERLTLELALHTTLGPVLIALRGAAAPEVEATYGRARELAERLDDGARLFLALWGLWYVRYGRGRYQDACEMGEQLRGLAEREGNTGWLLQAHHALWATLVAMGSTTAALAHCERGLALYDPAVHRSQAIPYGGHDPGVCCRYHLAVTEWLLGYPDRALTTLRGALGLADSLAHPMTTIIAVSFAVAIHHLRGDYAEAFAKIEDVVALAEAQGSLDYIQDGAAMRISAEIMAATDREQVSELSRRLTTGLVGQAGRSTWRDVIVLCLVADAFRRTGDVALGLEALDGIAEEHRAGFFASEVERIRGELHLGREAPDEAERCLRRAIEMARGRSERSLELRAATSLARFLSGTGKRREARRVLAEVYGWFTEGLDTADLVQARALLDDLKGA